MANPKYKMSKTKTLRRRANIRLAVPSLSICPTCKEPKMPHRVCPSCGKYRGRDVVGLEESATR